jgi:hypothetical protein
VQHDPILRIPSSRWQSLLGELHLRTRGIHESGAFLLGRVGDDARIVEQVVYYDDLDPNAYRTGVVVMHGASFGPLWELCRSRKLSAVADIHVHPQTARQSFADRDNPMIAQRGHLALIVPYFAAPPVRLETLGFFEYQGAHRWRDLSGRHVGRHLHIMNGGG